MKKYSFIIPENLNNFRIDKALSNLASEISRSTIQKAIKSSTVLLNNQIISDSSSKVKHNDIIDFTLPENQNTDMVATNIKLEIIFEDNDLIVINKPAGLTVHPGAGNHQNTLANALLYHTNSLSNVGGIERPGIVHRLDKDTSGLMVVAKNNIIHNKLAQQIQSRSLVRKYKALIWGMMKPGSGKIDLNIERNRLDRKKMSVAKIGGKEAITHYTTDKLFLGGKLSLITCKLQTGRTHQIRVHLSHLGHSIVGDQTYGSNNKKISILEPQIQGIFKNFTRQALHSYYLAFNHPANGELIEFEIHIADDILELITILH